ncbi:relaxase/mobilization nuclease domain-containing protein [Lacrimispora sp.]|uniref:relaxase/mobilization nuclease domain-containing protein n=1 Tax=Lacrimispora sp. TaxID=2719234 RepID=UPI0029DFBBB8|nr:hypothetical protein [Lacrimispora sp.]
MPYIKLVNEDNNKFYDTEDSIYNLAAYIFDVCKTTYDERRPGHMFGDYVGCSHFFGSEVQEKDAGLVAMQMIANNRAYGKCKNNLIMHRIISFRDLDYILPSEAFQLARYIANAYGEKYITAYGVHLDTNHIHIHLMVNSVSWGDGSRFSQSFERKWLWAMVKRWLNRRDEFQIRSPYEVETCMKYYGVG